MSYNTTEGKSKSSLEFLQVHLSDFLEFLIPKSLILEVIILPRDRVTFMPNAPPYIIGLFYHKNRIFFLVDVDIFLNPTFAPTVTDEYLVVTVENNDCLLGLTVKGVGVLQQIEKDKIL
ncbi:MAG: chemotaxis protein CheW [Geminocystis sp.]|nr:chemotaxis protein CheW [Geminocystis sp.]MCS7147959.1 chemotaxis protein CheW [Geminocystis sp.]MDW8116844.1 chemotaxis protein CheW [Geminocystis sp.]MDW8462508.1 chemotaxis protein CheW [Geminocystis sp.]